jgi:hypothetical protein
VIYDSKMNAEIKPNDNFDNPAGEMQVDNDGNPILPPIIEDKTEPPYIPPQMPTDNDLDFS